jgi:signal transduction histidine kinase
VGRLLVLDRPDFSLDEMMTASLAARQIESGLLRMGEIDALRRAAASEERLRMARDLHDGVLQTLSATAMHLEVIRRAPSDDRLGMAALQEWLVKEQRELRQVIERMRNGGSNRSDESDAEETNLDKIVEGVGQRWGIPVELTCSPPKLHLDADTTFQFQQIVREAAANAVRHGGATKLSVTCLARDEWLEIQILDNGKGLERHGAFDAEQCSDLGIGPRNLRDRVGALRGRFRLHSGPDGLQINISLPLNGRPS